MNTSSPWLSVVIPVYNGEKTIKRTIKSILKQTFSDYEVLVIDDGSTDSTSRICSELASSDNRIRYIRKSNNGSFQARLTGIKSATGKHITFCDADDYYASKNAFHTFYKKINQFHPALLQFGFKKKYNHMLKAGTPKYDDYFCNSYEFNKSEFPAFLRNDLTSSHLTPCLWNKVFHADLFRDFIDKGASFYMFWGDDLITNLNVLHNCPSALFISNRFYVYTQGGSTKRFSLHTMNDLDVLKQHQLGFLSKNPEFDTETIRNSIYGEIAAWFFIYVCDAIDTLDHETTIKMITDSLNLPTFKMAREHYLSNHENWTAVNLLRAANPDDYIFEAKKQNANASKMSKIKCMLKQLYTKI